MKLYFLSIVIILISLVGFAQQLQTPSYGRIERISVASKHVPTRPIDVWLPENYNTETTYNVLYMHDGQMLFDSNHTWNHKEWCIDETMQRLMQNNSIQPIIVVGIHNISSLRYAEYFPAINKELPQKIQTELQTKMNDSTDANKYLNYLVKEVKPYIDNHYSTNIAAKNTFIAGSSMGGLISLYALCEYPKIFGGAICMSTHWPGGDPNNARNSRAIFTAFKNYIIAHQSGLDNKRLYFDNGTATLDSFYSAYQPAIDRLFKPQQAKNKYISKIYKGDAHEENAWAKRFDIAALWLLQE